MKRQILYFYRLVLPDGRAHAIQIARAVRALSEQGADVTLYVRSGETPPDEGARLLGLETAPGLRIEAFPWKRRAQWPLTRRLIARRLTAAGGPRPVVYVRQVEHYSLHLCRVARRLGLPVICEAHNLKFLLVEESEGDQAAREWKAMEREIFAAASGLVFTAPLIEMTARRYFEIAAPCLLAPNAAPAPSAPVPSTSHSAPHPAGASPAASGRDIEVLYVGQLYAWKGIDLLIAAMAKLPARTLTVAGGATGPDLERARSLAREAGLEERIRFLGQIPPSDVPGLLARARVGVIPLPGTGSIEARLFTAPLKLFEFWAAGLPVVATDLPSTRALVDHGETGLLAPPDPDSLAGAIDRLLTDTALASRIAETAAGKALSYTWENRARSILDFIERVAG